MIPTHCPRCDEPADRGADDGSFYLKCDCVLAMDSAALLQWLPRALAWQREGKQ